MTLFPPVRWKLFTKMIDLCSCQLRALPSFIPQPSHLPSVYITLCSPTALPRGAKGHHTKWRESHVCDQHVAR